MLFNFNNKKVENVKFNGLNLNKLRFNGTIVWERNGETPVKPDPPISIYSWTITPQKQVSFTADDKQQYGTYTFYSSSNKNNSKLYFDQQLKYETTYTLLIENNRFFTNDKTYEFNNYQIVYTMDSQIYNESYINATNTQIYMKNKALEIGDKVYYIGAHFNSTINDFDFMGFALRGEVHDVKPTYLADFGIITTDEYTYGCTGINNREIVFFDMAQWKKEGDFDSLLTFSRNPSINSKLYITSLVVDNKIFNDESLIIKNIGQIGTDGNIKNIFDSENNEYNYIGTFRYVGPRPQV